MKAQLLSTIAKRTTRLMNLGVTPSTHPELYASLSALDASTSESKLEFYADKLLYIARLHKPVFRPSRLASRLMK